MCLRNSKHLLCANKIRASFKLMLWGSHDNVLHTGTVASLCGLKHSISKGSVFVDNHICEDS